MGSEGIKSSPKIGICVQLSFVGGEGLPEVGTVAMSDDTAPFLAAIVPSSSTVANVRWCTMVEASGNSLSRVERRIGRSAFLV